MDEFCRRLKLLDTAVIVPWIGELAQRRVHGRQRERERCGVAWRGVPALSRIWFYQIKDCTPTLVDAECYTPSFDSPPFYLLRFVYLKLKLTIFLIKKRK